MNMFDERIQVFKGTTLIGEYWAMFTQVRGQSVVADDAEVEGQVKVILKVLFRPDLKPLITDPVMHRIVFLRGYAPNGQVVNAFRMEDRRYMQIEL